MSYAFGWGLYTILMTSVIASILWDWLKDREDDRRY